MHRSMAVIVLGLAGVCPAQTWTWMADVSSHVVEPGDHVTVTISALMAHDTPFIALASHEHDLINLDGGDFGEVTGFQVLNHLDELISYLIETDGDSMLHIPGGQLTAFGHFTSDNPIDVFEFTWIAEAPGEVSYTSESLYTYLWAGHDKDSAAYVEVTSITDVSFGWTVVPAPPVVMVLGIGLASGRRRIAR